MNDLLLNLESKMVNRKVISFKMKDGTVTNFSIDVNFLNTDIANIIKDMAEISMYLESINAYIDNEVIMPLLLIKHFVKQVKVGNKGKQTEIEIIKQEKSIKETYEMLVRYGNALMNIENQDGVSLFEILLKEFDSNKDGFATITDKINALGETLSKTQ